MNEQSSQNKKAWEYRAYEFWNKRDGTPETKAKIILENPELQLKKHIEFFRNIKGKKIANLCGSNGRKAVPLAIIGAVVTVFDISEENKRYALELAENANTYIEYIVTDIYDIDLVKYENSFDMLYLEGGILHYFNDIDKFMSILFTLLKQGGEILLSDFHPLRRCIVKNPLNDSEYQIQLNYFNKELHNGDIAYKNHFDENEQNEFPNVSIRLFTLSEIINSVIKTGFKLRKFDEHRGWENENIPWEFTISAFK
ncbi:class I SAM-dependent methyltransferase [Rummeliibacillus stabekisii]|uniref:class I SAM-dependent methyltransferase n=1 Tax=Rummeliibacillus stabekisii TaxID=241244 RepID=UPI001170D968|nr:class I SAM-dependent methyltransferase [Rummeliibacillus stabekisii]MBB5168817.1 SAM-dependent methyltransferase [Rummeliibacillus stabekisii]GEL05041.1 methyltransferase [Rummeliibacillus stabekisii]